MARDLFTATVDGAAAFERWHAQPFEADDRPTRLEAERDEWEHQQDDSEP